MTKRLFGLGAALVLALVVAGSPARAQVKTTEIVKEVKAAFTAWEGISCSGLKFEYKGLLTSHTLIKKGAIVVNWGHDKLTWTHGTEGYHSEVNIEDDATAAITDAYIDLNAKDYWWAFDKEKNKLDIQTAVFHMIPAVIGFYVGNDPINFSLRNWIKFDFKDRTRLPLHERGAQYTYFKSGTGCTQPSKPVICGKTAPPPDAGTGDAAAVDAAVADASTADAGLPNQLCIFHSKPNDPTNGKPYHWAKLPIPYYIYVPNRGKLPGSTDTSGDAGGGDGGGGGDSGLPECHGDEECPSGQTCSNGKCVGGKEEDDGCCRVSYTRTENITYGLLCLLGLGLLIWRSRRRRG
jgi:hypothetical protein